MGNYAQGLCTDEQGRIDKIGDKVIHKPTELISTVIGTDYFYGYYIEDTPPPQQFIVKLEEPIKDKFNIAIA